MQAVCDQVLIIAHGRLVAMGTPNELAGRLEGHQTLTATAQGEAACVLAAAAGVEGLTDVTLTGEKDGEVSFTANAPAGSDLRGALSAALAAAGCPVLALGTAAVSLEDVFLQLVEESAPEAAEKQAAPEPPAEAPEDSARPEPEDRSSEEENAE